ncbi:MFS transporter [Sphingobium sp. DEHP117]|uniref:MFS transporter n=1 Tax=Sphingobium sp. DEHP117 TaxID=2993436 RepID=UPI0027D62500|nr:MFS transporter [Sphingobium sp. DEHP117]MDQ4421567.1 MFS transporter [Sphingobium sp. DEHP117]
MTGAEATRPPDVRADIPPDLTGPPASEGGAPWMALLVLTMCFALAFTDRQILNLVVDHMKRDYLVSDKQIGFLLGPAFTITYVSVGLFAGFCADRLNRRNLLVVAGLIWSLATFASALAPNFETMVATRMLVGASEAFLFPSGMSLVADLFDRRRLPLATTIFLTAPYIGGGIALILGGIVIGQTEGMAPISLSFGVMRDWQVAIALVGVLGAIPILSLLLLREPGRAENAVAGEDLKTFGFWEGTIYMFKRWRFFIALFMAVSFNSVLLNTVPAWAPTMFIRQYGMDAQGIGVIYGTMILVLGIVAGLASPAVNSIFARNHADAPIRTTLIGPAILLAAGLGLVLAGSPTLALVCIAIITFGYVFPLPMAGTALQLASPPRLRGMASAYYFVIVSVIGVGIGPTLVPFTADNLLRDADNLNTAIAIVTIVCAIVCFVFMRVALGGFRIERGLAGKTAASRNETGVIK